MNRLGQTVLFPGVAQMVWALQRAAIPTAIVTTSVSFYAQRVLEHHGLRPTMLVAYHDAPRPKPAPDSIRKALGMMQLPAQQCLGLGDKLTDLQAYQAAGVRAIGAAGAPT